METLDQHIRNRGLGICNEMMRCCGHEAEVRNRVDRLINEQSGEMRELSNTVTLNIGHNKRLGEECLCNGQLGVPILGTALGVLIFLLAGLLTFDTLWQALADKGGEK